MKLILFSKSLSSCSGSELEEFAKENGLDGDDLTVRPGHPVNPEKCLFGTSGNSENNREQQNRSR